MALNSDDVARVRQASDIVEVVSGHSGLKKVGRRWTGLCPFHGEKTPSFSVNAEEGLYFCFGCGAKGDVITFMREIEHLDFVEAVERLASRANIEIRHDSEAASADRKRRKRLVEAMERAVDWYHERLLSSPDASQARAYLRERGYDGEVVRRFRIGWAPVGWDQLSRALSLRGDVLKDSGLGFVNRAGRTQDAFRERILFPIFDPSGSPVAFGGRILPGASQEGPKYKNSSETPIYVKSRTLYGLNWAKNDIVDKNEVVVCEGYTDVIAFFNSGVPRAVATCGTALTQDHVRQMRNFATRIVLAYDADKAGQAAAERFYEWEQKFELEIVVAAFPSGMDPADAARRDASLLPKAVSGAKSFLGFRIDRLLNDTDLQSPESRARAAQRCLAMIAEHPNDLVRDQYVMVVADRCQLNAERLRESLTNGTTLHDRAIAKSPVVDVRDPPTAELRSELEAIQVAIQQPEDASALLGRITGEREIVELETLLFSDDSCQAAFHSLATSATLHDAIDQAEPDARDLMTRLAVEEDEGGVDAILRLVDRAATRKVRELQVETRVDPTSWERVGPAIAWLKLEVERLRRQETSLSAAEAIVDALLTETSSPAAGTSA